MSINEKQRQTEKFVGCILSVKTKPGQYGSVQHILGTVREIDVASSEQAIVLDQAMSNGVMLPDGFVLLTSQIADLQVMGKADEIQANLHSAYSKTDAARTPTSEVKDHEGKSNGFNNSHQLMSSGSGDESKNSAVLNGGSSAKLVNGNHSSPQLRRLDGVNAITSSIAKTSLSENDMDSNSHLIAKPKPRKPNSNVNSPGTPTSHHKNNIVASLAAADSKGSNGIKSPGTNYKPSTNAGLSNNSTSINGSDILLRTFGSMGTNSGVSANGQALMNAMNNSTKSSSVPGAQLKLESQSPSKHSPQKPLYDHKKLGVLSQFVKSDNSDESRSALTITPSGKKVNNNATEGKTPRGRNGRQQAQRHGETFETMSKDEMSTDFDFEGSNAQFEKLPVTTSKPTKVVKNPHFSTTDTTYNADRAVESITLKDSVTSTKVFVTDTGVVIPAVDLPTRSKILNLAHEVGLTHHRVVEIMGRAVAQAALPLLGDSYRLSPEREEDRPWVMVAAGPHWQGAIGISAARILASMGVHTCVYSPKEEIQLCTPEEFLYNLTGERLTRQISDLKGIQFDLVIMAAEDHLSRKVNFAPYSQWIKKCPVVFVDPPLISSYRQELDACCGTGNKSRKIVIVSPVLPVAYPADSTVKIFLVNIGIPQGIFEQNGVSYKSPFGDKLFIQIYSNSK